MDRLKKMLGFETNRNDSSQEKKRKKDLGSEQIKFWSDVTTADGLVRTVTFDDVEISGKEAGKFYETFSPLINQKIESPQQSIIIIISGCTHSLEFRVGSLLGKLTNDENLDLTVFATQEQIDAYAKMHGWNPKNIKVANR